MADEPEAVAGAPRCEECGAPATCRATPKELMDDPGRPWYLCDVSYRTLATQRRVGPARKL